MSFNGITLSRTVYRSQAQCLFVKAFMWCYSGRNGEAVEIPWWTYGARGMQLWFPSSLGEPVSPAAAARSRPATDPELEFDREVYPIGISLAEVSIVGRV